MFFLIILISISSVLSILCLIYIMKLIYWFNAGQHLANFGYASTSSKPSYILMVLLLPLFFIIDLIGKNPLEIKDIITIWFIVVYPISMILGSYGKNQIKEKGIFTESLYIRWDEIKDYEVVENRVDGKYILLILKNKKQFRHRIKIRNIDEKCELLIKKKIAR